MTRGPLPVLDRLDARFAAPLRRRPEVAFLLVAVVFAAGAGARLALLARQASSQAGPTAGTAGPQSAPEDPALAALPGQTVVGPAPGQDPAAYAQAHRGRMAARAAADPHEPVSAIVSLDPALEPQQAADLLAAVDVGAVAARYRLQAEPAAARRLPLHGDPVASLAEALAREAQAARAEAQALEDMRASTDDPAFAETFAGDRDRLLAAADAAADGVCACVYALEVRGPARALAALSAARGVRLVDPAPPGADPAAVTFRAVLPGAEDAR